MKEKTTISYSYHVYDDNTNESKVEYNKYTKSPDDMEKLLTYKKIVKNDLSGNNITNKESFNELHKNNTDINEVIGHSCNKKDWNVAEYNNYNLEKKYKTEYENIKLDINYDLLEKYDTKYLKDK
jgi:hypothetical protein